MLINKLVCGVDLLEQQTESDALLVLKVSCGATGHFLETIEILETLFLLENLTRRFMAKDRGGCKSGPHNFL